LETTMAREDAALARLPASPVPEPKYAVLNDLDFAARVRPAFFSNFGDTRGHSPAPSGFTGVSASAPAMPIHPHFTDPAFPGLAEDGAARVHPFAGAAAAKYALEFGGKPRSCRVDLAGAEGDLRLVIRHIQPVAPYGIQSTDRGRERRLDKNDVRRVDRGQEIDITLGPTSAKGVDQ